MLAAGLAYREAGSPERGTVLLVHGYPESSYMWRHALPAVGAVGWRAIAPDLSGYGDSPLDRPGTWERHVESLERFIDALGLSPVVLVTHDWGVMIGLRWACEHPDSVRALVISDGGFFSDRRWHDLANVMRTPEEGERLVRGYTRDALGSALHTMSGGITDDAIEEYWKGFADDERRMAHLDLYRSGDFEKLKRYDGALKQFEVPALILWGANDRFASVKMAHRFHDEIPDAELVILDDAGHFNWEDAPERTTDALVAFLQRL
ncbi:MAG: alpha/beta fold hydrolase [Solirubrobacterales bacterium]|nr:alpha/beta fold hydrolase [Solirubrobacterales bacterium]